MTLYWGGYEYNIAAGRIDTISKAYGWILHVTEKSWRGTTNERIHNLMRALADRHGWSVDGM